MATRKFVRSVRLPEGDVPAGAGAGLSKSAASRRFVALSAARMKEWMASDLSGLDLLVIQIDGIYLDLSRNQIPSFECRYIYHDCINHIV